jgi:hypothetical protein
MIQIGHAYRETFGKALPEKPKKTFAQSPGPLSVVHSWLDRLNS